DACWVGAPLSGQFWIGGEDDATPRCGQSTDYKLFSKTALIGICKQFWNSKKKNLLSQPHHCSTADYTEDAADPAHGSRRRQHGNRYSYNRGGRAGRCSAA